MTQRHALLPTFTWIFILLIFQIANSASTNGMPPIFQIGFNKVGTTSIWKFMRANGIPSLHWDYKDKNHKETYLGPIMFTQYLNDIPLLSNLLDEYVYFGDFGVYVESAQDFDIIFVDKAAKPWYQVLLSQHADSLFILNIRSVNHWLKSRYFHHELSYLNEIKEIAGIDIYDKNADFKLLTAWKQLWYQYICGLLQYFTKHNVMDKLLIYDIEHDDVNKLVSFFESHGIELFADLMSHEGRTTKEKKLDSERFNKWQRIIKQYPQFDGHSDDYSEWNQIQDTCF